MSPPRTEPQRRISFGRAIMYGVLAFVLWRVGGWVHYHFFMSEEDHIRLVLQGAVDGANDRSPREVTRILSMDFKGPHNLNRDEIHQACMHLLMGEYRVVKFELSPQPVPVQLDSADKKKATATFKVSGKGKQSEGSEWEDIGRLVGSHLNEAANPTLKASFKKTDEGWLMYTVEVVPADKP